MKIILLLASCLLVSLILLPGGIASWGGTLDIEGTVTTAQLPESSDSSEEETAEAESTEVEEADEAEKDGDSIYPDTDAYNLTVIVRGEGTTDPEEGIHEYDEGDEVRLTADPDKGWELIEWLIDGKDTDSSNSITVNIDDDIEVSVIFAEKDAPDEDENEDEKGDKKDDEKQEKDEEEGGSKGAEESKEEDSDEETKENGDEKPGEPDDEEKNTGDDSGDQNIEDEDKDKDEVDDAEEESEEDSEEDKDNSAENGNDDEE